MRERFKRAIRTINEYRLLNKEPHHVYMEIIGKDGISDINTLGETAVAAMLVDNGMSLEGYKVSLYQSSQEKPQWRREVQEGDLLRVCTKFVSVRDAIISVNQWIEMQHWFVAYLGNVKYSLTNNRGLLVPIPDEVRVKLGVEPRRPPHISFRR